MSVDIAISFDTTGSIYPALAEIRRKVVTFIDTLFKETPNLRISLIAHGDYNDRYAPIVVPLTSDKSKLIHFAQTVGETNGFGNGGEAYGWAMSLAADLDWKAEKRVYILIGDENVHEGGQKIASGGYRAEFTVPHYWRSEQNRLIQSDVKTIVVRCLNRSDSVKFHNELARMNNTPLLSLAQFKDIGELLTAVTYAQVSIDRVDNYATELESRGLFNRNLRHIFDQITGRTTNAKDFNKTSLRTDGLIPVDPSRFQILHVDNEVAIKDFVQSTGAKFKIGAGFYELTKMEEIQPNKEIVLVERSTGDMFSGSAARNLLRLPYGERGRRTKSDVPHGYTAYVQSTSNNRKLMGNTTFLYEVDYV